MRGLPSGLLRNLARALVVLVPLIAGDAGAAQTSLSLDPFPRDRAIIDSGSARAEDAATVRLSGTAPPGARVMGRFIDASGDTTGWTALATAGTDGRWTAGLGPLTRGQGWVRPQVRRDREDAPIRTGQEVSAGHVVAIWGQSEFHRAVLPAHAALDQAPRVRDADALRVTFSSTATDAYGDPSNFIHRRITDATPVSAHMAALSNMLAEAAPGERFHFIFHTRAGTGFQQLLDGSATGRRWADAVRLHDHANFPGARPGLAWISWYNTDASLKTRYAPVLFAALTGRSIDGRPVARGAVPDGGRRPLDHTFADLYGPGMVWAIAGPHRFEMDKFDAPIAAIRASVDAVFGNTPQWTNLRRALEPLTYLNGNPRWGGDYSHPDTVANPRDGMTRLILLMGNSVLRQLGLADWPLPAFDRARPSDDGTQVEVWSSAGPVTTTRAVRTGQPGAPVAGFAINGHPAADAVLRDGRVVISSPNNRPFPAGTRLTFGGGGIGTQTLERDTREVQVWRDYPIVDLGQTGLEGIPIKAQTPQSVLGVFAPRDAPTDPLPPGNILPETISRFVASPRPPGWVKVGAGWSLDPRAGTATARLLSRGFARAALPRGAMESVQGQRLLLTFVPDASGSDPERMRLVVAATGGSPKRLFSDDIVLTPGRRMVLPLARYPTDRTGLSISLRRGAARTGTITLGSLGLYVRQ